MKELLLLDLSRNNISGELALCCLSLVVLDLSDNNLFGQIFPKHMNLPQLNLLNLDNNHFSGKIEDGLLSSIELKELHISNNMFSAHIPHWIGNFSSGLEVLSMSKNHFDGNIPVQFNNLEILDISESNLSGSLSNLSSVKHVFMQQNALSGYIPGSLFRSSELMTLDLRGNKFSGRIPHQINEHSNLRVLLLRGNYLQGHIPNQLCQLAKLGMMDLSHNRLNGSIPSCLGKMLFWRAGDGHLYGPELQLMRGFAAGSMVVYSDSSIHDDDDDDDDQLPPTRAHTSIYQRVQLEFATKNRYEFYNGSNLDYMSGLDLSCNELSGEIPKEIGQLHKIRALNLSNNLLSGAIPESFSNLEMIESLDLSHNKLSGQIAYQLTALNFLSNFNVSYNNLSGPTPDKGQFGTFDENSYRGYLDLCVSQINKKCGITLAPTPTATPSGDESAIDMLALKWSFAASYVTVILGLFAVLWVNSYWRRLWFYFIDGCIDTCYYWLFKYVLSL